MKKVTMFLTLNNFSIRVHQDIRLLYFHTVVVILSASLGKFPCWGRFNLPTEVIVFLQSDLSITLDVH